VKDTTDLSRDEAADGIPRADNVARPLAFVMDKDVDRPARGVPAEGQFQSRIARDVACTG